ncbi:MAG: alpha/beta fold hydrolase [Calditrichia bacterium]
MNPNISSAFTKVEDTNIHYLTVGKGETILFLHGWPTSSYLWRDMMQALSEKYQVIAMDLPGFGKSDKRPEDSYSFRYYERIISGFLKNLKIEKITLGVHDLGGPLGLYWMIQHMEQVNRLILFNTLVYPQFSNMVKLFGLSTMLPGIRHYLSSAAGLKKAMLFGVYQKDKLTDEAIENYQAPFIESDSRKALLKTVQRLSKKGFEEISAKLKGFKGPVQILYGEDDKILPKVADTMQRVKKDLPQAHIKSFPNCGHFLQEEIPDQLAEAVLEFMVT